MSAATELLLDAYSRVKEAVHRAGERLDKDALAARLDPDANSIGWLLWHLTRVQDDHVADVAGREELWTAEGWDTRFDLPVSGIGYGHSSEEVGAVRGFDAELALAYYDAVQEQTLAFLRGLRDEDLDRVVDEAWDPPVTLGVRLVSVVDDCLEHAGQAAFVRGVLERTRS
ncbi:DinB family protein [Georgenia satyanarayanai]|uniref:mycothiol transferase n=1 Tax=Georgenia satyanarayanai TaxID=860221 RepID=UPI002041DF48|nr:DinB family protein [Georgenia satyanarayanai]MCM3662224.1 DinB family protein [Georgenia satyanarayanai]